MAHNPRKRKEQQGILPPLYLCSAQSPVAKACSPALSSACIRSQEDMEMNVFLPKNLQHTGHATFNPAMRRLT